MIDSQSRSCATTLLPGLIAVLVVLALTCAILRSGTDILVAFIQVLPAILAGSPPVLIGEALNILGGIVILTIAILSSGNDYVYWLLSRIAMMFGSTRTYDLPQPQPPPTAVLVMLSLAYMILSIILVFIFFALAPEMGLT